MAELIQIVIILYVWRQLYLSAYPKETVVKVKKDYKPPRPKIKVPWQHQVGKIVLGAMILIVVEVILIGAFMPG